MAVSIDTIANLADKVAMVQICLASEGKIDYGYIAVLSRKFCYGNQVFDDDGTGKKIARKDANGNDVFEGWGKGTAQTGVSTARTALSRLSSDDKAKVIEAANNAIAEFDFDFTVPTVEDVEMPEGQRGRGQQMSKRRGNRGGKILKVGSIGFDKAMGLNTDENGRN